MFVLWEELNARILSVVNAELYLTNINDKELTKVAEKGLQNVILPHLEEIETVLKKEGFTVPPRPVRRLSQGPSGQVGQIILNDDEVLAVIVSAGQIAIQAHMRGYCSAVREDIRKHFKNFLSSEIDQFEAIMKLSSERNTLENPPVVTSKRG